MRAIAVNNENKHSSNSMFIDSRPLPELDCNSVLIKVKAAGINRADTLQRKGSYPPPPGVTDILGLEVSGVVESGPLPQNSRVMALVSGGGYAEYVSVPVEHCLPIPDNMDFIQAAAIPENFLAAFMIMRPVLPNSSVLIHAAASGVGTAAIQLAKLRKCKVFATAGSDVKCEMAQKLGASVAINYKTTNWKEVVLQSTNGIGVDTILDPVGSSHFEDNLACSNIDSTLVLYGLLSGPKINNGPHLGTILRKRITISGMTLRSRSVQYKAELIREFSDVTKRHFEDGHIFPIIDSAFEFEDVNLAHQKMEANENIGKIVLKF